MNKDQIKGTIKTTEGKIQEKVGKFVGSKNQQAKGLAKQGAGKAEENIVVVVVLRLVVEVVVEVAVVVEVVY